MNRVRISDSAHALVLMVYLLAAVNGMLFQSGLASASVLEEQWPHLVYVVWASVMLLSGAACFVSALVTPRMVDPRNSLVAELIGCIGLVITFGCYEWSLLQRPPPPPQPGEAPVLLFAATTQVFAVAYVLGAFARDVQITVDLLRLRRAFKTPEG